MEFVLFLLFGLVVEGFCEKVDEKIQGGEDVNDIARFPFIGYYLASLKGFEQVCTGILVDQFSAITAGHCVVLDTEKVPHQLLPLKTYHVSIVMGSADYSEVSNPFYKLRNINKLFIHPKAEFNHDWPIRDKYDIGAMKWKKKVTLNSRIQLVPLIPQGLGPDKVLNQIIEAGGHCELAGWGDLEVNWLNPEESETSYKETLQVSHFDIKSKEACCTIYFAKGYEKCMQRLGVEQSGLLCHVRHKLNTSAATGDSGSPLYCPYKGKKYVVGMHVAGVNAFDPPPKGPVQVAVPGLFVIDTALRPYISKITGTAGGFTNTCEKRSVGHIWPIPFFATVTSSILQQ